MRKTIDCRWGLLLAVMAAAMWMPVTAFADISSFNEWTLVQDPPHANFTSSVDSVSQITLRAIAGPIPMGTDIGYQSVNGIDVAGSSSGWAFDPGQDFSVAIDFNLSFGLPSGGFSIGMGIGEDRDGANSAGVVLTSQNGGFLTFVGAARVNNVNQPPVTIGVAGQTSGRFIVSYLAASGNVILGVSTDGDDTPEGTGTFGGIQNLWNEDSLLVSFFARSDNGVFAWNSGTANAVFTGFHVVSGAPFAIPESSPACLAVFSLFLPALYRKHDRSSG